MSGRFAIRSARASLFTGLLGVALTAAGARQAASSENWPFFRGPRLDGRSDARGLPRRWSETENVVWKTPIHGRGWSSPVVWGGQVWVTTAAEDGRRMFAVCADRETGAVLHDIEVFRNAAPRPIHVTNSYASPTPAIEEGRVYVHFGSYGTACLDTRTGRRLWSRRDLPCNHFRGPGSSPILFEKLLIVHFDGFDHQYVAALEKESGRTVWLAERSHDFLTDNGDFKKAYSTPIVIEAAGRLQLISPASRAAVSYDPRTGRELWRVTFRGFSSTAMPLYGCGLVFVNTGFSKGTMLAVRPDGRGDVTETHVVWKLARGVPSKPTPVLAGERIYMVDDRGIASAVDARSGEVIWTHRMGGAYSASPIYADGVLYFSSEEGTTTVVRPGDTYEEIAANRLESGFMATPAVAGRALFLRTRTHLYRIEERGSPAE